MGKTFLLCIFAAIGAAKVVTFLTGSAEFGGLAGLLAFVGNLFAIEPIKDPIIKVGDPRLKKLYPHLHRDEE